MAGLEDLPAELAIKVLDFTHPAGLVGLSQTNRRWYSLATKRLKKHKEDRAKYRFLNDGLLWHDVLLTILRDPWIGHYVTRVSMNFKVRHRRLLSSGIAGSTGSYMAQNDVDLIQETLIESIFSPEIESLFTLFEELHASLQRVDGLDEAPIMAILLSLLPNVERLLIRVPQSWSGMKIIQKVVKRIAVTHFQEPGRLAGLGNLRHVQVNGQHSARSSRADASYLQPFMALPKASSLKLVRVGALKVTLDNAIPFSSLTSLILIHSPFGPNAISAMLSRTPYLQRFVCMRQQYANGNDRLLQYESRTYLTALFTYVADSLQFLALDAPLDPPESTCVHGTSNLCYGKLKALSSLRALFIHAGILFSTDKVGLDKVLPLGLKTLAVKDFNHVRACDVKSMKELVLGERGQIEYLVAPECKTIDLEVIIENELLKEACSQVGVTIETEATVFRSDVITGLDDKWKEYV